MGINRTIAIYGAWFRIDLGSPSIYISMNEINQENLYIM